MTLEYKERCYSVRSFSSAMLELPKHTDLMELNNLLDVGSLYMMDFEEVISVYELKRTYDWFHLPCKRTAYSDDEVAKQVAFLPYSEATYIVSKKTWNNVDYARFNTWLTEGV